MIPDSTSNPIENPEKIISSASERQSSGWDIRNAPRNYLSLVLSQIGSAAFSFGAVWLITRNLGSEGYGGIVAVIAASQVAQVLVNWTSVAVVRFGVDEFIETEKIARTFWVRLVILLINLVIVLSLAGFWFPPLAEWLKLSPGAFWLVILHFAVTALWLHIQMSLQGAKMPRVQGFLQMIERLLIFAAFLILLAIAEFNFFWVLVCYIAAPAAMILVGLVQIRSYILSRFSIDRQFIKKIVAYSVPLLPFSLVGYFSGSYVDAIFISKYLSTRDLGIYSVATQISGIALQLPTLANTLLLPLLITLQTESGDQRTFNYFRNVLPSLTLVWGVACSFVSLVFYFALPVVFGSDFAETILPLWILLTASVTVIPVAIGYSALSNSTSATYIAMYAAVLSAVVNIAANFVLIPKYGMAGCAWATLMAYLVNLITYSLLLRRSAKMPVSWTFLAMLPSLVGVWIFTFYQDPWLALVVCLAMSCLIGVWFKASVRQSFSFLANFVKI